MSSIIEETDQNEYLDEYINMEQLLEVRFASKYIFKILESLNFNRIVNMSQHNEENYISTGENDEYVIPHSVTSIIPYTTLRMHNIAQLSSKECATAIASHLQSSNRFMQDDSASKRFRLETLRAMPQCLTVKKFVKSQLAISQKTEKKPISYWKLLRYNTSLKFRKVILMLLKLFSLDNV